MFWTQNDLAILQPELEVHQRYNFFAKDHPQYLSRCSATRPDSGHQRSRVEHYPHSQMVSQVISLLDSLAAGAGQCNSATGYRFPCHAALAPGCKHSKQWKCRYLA